MLKKRRRINMFRVTAAPVFFAILIASCPVSAFVQWSNASGTSTAGHFDWANGGSDNGLFGSPYTLTNGFRFFPSNFRAESVNGVADIAADRLEFDLHAHEGYVITGLHITEYGDYGITGTGSVSATGTMFLCNLNAFDVMYDNLITDPPSSMTAPTDSNCQWEGHFDVEDFEWTDFKVILDNNLMAISTAGSVTFIEKKILDAAVAIEIITEPIPEPATVALIATGAWFVIREKFPKK